MTFYNLPDTDVKIEYDKDTKTLAIFPLPYEATVDTEPVDLPYPGEPKVLLIKWGQK